MELSKLKEIKNNNKPSKGYVLHIAFLACKSRKLGKNKVIFSKIWSKIREILCPVLFLKVGKNAIYLTKMPIFVKNRAFREYEIS